MPITAEEEAFARDLFDGLAPISIKRMFGGAGIFAEGVMFALMLADGEIYMKADGDHAEEMAAEGARQFEYPKKDGKVARMGYWTLPEAALDDPEEALSWARRSLALALSRKQA